MDNSGATTTALEKAIMQVMVFFDLFNYPLTAYEVWQYLDVQSDLETIKNTVADLACAGTLAEANGFYFLSGRAEVIAERRRRYNFTNKKIKIARIITNMFSVVPFVKLVAVSNIIGARNLRDESDIDLFIITAANRIWLTRLICAGLMKILNLRPNKKTKRNKICLSFYTTVKHLNIKDLKLNDDDNYFNYWLLGLVPLLDREFAFRDFMKANAWVRPYFPNWPFDRTPVEGVYVDEPNNFLDYLEGWAKKFQMKIMPKDLQDASQSGNNVVISDDVLKLYKTDRRQEFIEQFKKKFYEISE